MTLGERVKYIRKDLKMTQNSFGESLGLKRDAINNLELGRNKTINDSVLRLICKTHRVNYFWLTEEDGEPYIGIPDVIVDEAVEQYDLDDLDRKLIEEYVKLEPKVRAEIKKYLQTVFSNNAPD